MGGGIPFKNLGHLTDGTLVPGNPDHYHGARPEQLDKQIQIELSHQIVPSTQHDLPIAPNFFLAVKGPDGSASVAKRQACYDDALGARGLHSLQTYGKDGPEFDNNAMILKPFEKVRPGIGMAGTGHWAKEQRDEAISRANEKATQEATQDIVESGAANTSFSTVCEIPNTESVASITEQSYFSFNGTNTTSTHSLRKDWDFSH
ncbi:hypothetical protein TSTA_080040 [Talaromyces stipitatus ATCC 10500]|uniref:Uncharacterized protein n=1 Tax=Talaromyces stipitatus (strain ATCC 10500 / CBS 375.48 / QM 6759 / NRRL 1006) TaxID=441959 RepID=B8LXR4_TALSN|nr:uncharacterized protein TSTA_080040 [Talaromyces stipitatus ATCC 10500]EED24649.1 hypothetical protein TSTA_080040 [Talaromyces stipitatus ATCC 10500]